jgi:hypothetical protein
MSGKIKSGSEKVFADGIKVARVGDPTIGEGSGADGALTAGDLAAKFGFTPLDPASILDGITGLIKAASLGSGTANSTTILTGAGTYVPLPTGGSTSIFDGGTATTVFTGGALLDAGGAA